MSLQYTGGRGCNIQEDVKDTVGILYTWGVFSILGDFISTPGGYHD